MSSTLRAALLSSALSLTVGCGFFSVEDADQPVKPKKETSSAGKPGAAGMGAAGTGAAVGGAGGMATTGGSAGTGPSSGGSGGAAGSGAGGAAAGMPGAGSGGTMAGAGGAGAGAPPTGGAGGDAALGGMGGMTAGGPAGGMSGAAGGGSVTCTSLNAAAQAFAGHCYLLVTTAAKWPDAKSACAGMMGAHLVTISNGMPPVKETFDAEDQFIFTLGGGHDTWLGLTDGKMDHDAGDGTPYTWITGEDNPPSDWGTAYGWVDGEPNNYNKMCADQSNCYEHCGMMVADQAGKWNDDLCETPKQYVCEWEMGG